MKTSELTGAALDWAVAKCEGWEWVYVFECDFYDCRYRYKKSTKCGGFKMKFKHEEDMRFSSNWNVGGPIIEREKIQILPRNNDWVAVCFGPGKPITGPTPLIAAMRCYATSLGDEIEIPEELT